MPSALGTHVNMTRLVHSRRMRLMEGSCPSKTQPKRPIKPNCNWLPHMAVHVTEKCVSGYVSK